MVSREGAALAPLLRRAQLWQEAGNTHQAIATYFRLMEYFPGSDEAEMARGELFDLAQRLETQGHVYQAIHLYNRLASLG